MSFAESGRIQSVLDRPDHFVFLQGMGGIGKTETAKQYAIKNANQYDTVVFARCDDSLMNLLNDNTVFTLTSPFNSERIKDRIKDIDEQVETDDAYYRRKLAALRNAVNNQTLIILDNVDHKDSHLKDFWALPCFVVITTRWTSQELYPDATIEIEQSTDMEFCRKVFWAQYYNTIEYALKIGEKKLKAINSDTNVDAMIDYFNGHILALELIAKQMKVSCMSAGEMWQCIQDQKEDELEEEFLMSCSDAERNLMMHLRQIFNIAGLSDEQTCVLYWLSLLPQKGIGKKEFRKCCKLNNYIAINELSKRSWIQDKDEVLIVHPLIIETVQCSYKPDHSKESCLIYQNVAHICLGDDNGEQESQNVEDAARALMCYNNALTIIEELSDSTPMEYAAIYNGIAYSAFRTGNVIDALEYGHKSLEICEMIIDEKARIHAYDFMAGCYCIASWKDYSESEELSIYRLKRSVEYAEKKLAILKLNPITSIETGTNSGEEIDLCYIDLAWTSLRFDLTKAVMYWEEYLTCIRSSNDESDYLYEANETYSRIAKLYEEKGDAEMAQKYRDKIKALSRNT